MKALVYYGQRNVTVMEVTGANIQPSLDASVNIPTTNVYGSDLHCRMNRVMSRMHSSLAREFGKVVPARKGERATRFLPNYTS